jgi:hypothetical protein
MPPKCPKCGNKSDLQLVSEHRDPAINRDHAYKLTPVAIYRCSCGVTWAETSLLPPGTKMKLHSSEC